MFLCFTDYLCGCVLSVTLYYKYKVRDLGTCWNNSFRKIFHFNRWESVSKIQHYCGELSFVDMYNKYKAKFLNSIISTDYSVACVRIWTWIDK